MLHHHMYINSLTTISAIRDIASRALWNKSIVSIIHCEHANAMSLKSIPIFLSRQCVSLIGPTFWSFRSLVRHTRAVARDS